MKGARLLEASHLGACTELMASLPLFQRYGLTQEKARVALLGAQERQEPVWVAESDAGGVLGLAWVQPLGLFMRSPYLKWLAVAPGVHGGGVGKQLLRAAEEAARAFFERRFVDWLREDLRIGRDVEVDVRWTE